MPLFSVVQIAISTNHLFPFEQSNIHFPIPVVERSTRQRSFVLFVRRHNLGV